MKVTINLLPIAIAATGCLLVLKWIGVQISWWVVCTPLLMMVAFMAAIWIFFIFMMVLLLLAYLFKVPGTEITWRGKKYTRT